MRDANITSFLGYKLLKEAGDTMEEIVASAEEGMAHLSCVNLLSVDARRRQKAIKNMARFKVIAAMGRPEVTKAVESKIRQKDASGLGNKPLSYNEMVDIISEIAPDALMVRLQ
jgi:hypothetical protein